MPFRGDRLRRRRLDLGISQEELASQLQTVQNHISRLETGKVEPSTDMLERLSKALNTSVDYLMGLADSPDKIANESELSDEEKLLLQAIRDGLWDVILEYAARELREERAKEKRLGDLRRAST